MAAPSLLKLSNNQARELAGKSWSINGKTYWFNRLDPSNPGEPPWNTGSEGMAYPLVGATGKHSAYFKSFLTPSMRRIERVAWLTGQQLHDCLPQLAGAPRFWLDTRRDTRPDDVDFDIAGYFSQAVPGMTWIEFKYAYAKGTVDFSEKQKWCAAEDLITSLALLEQAGICHGDLSHNNVLVDAHGRRNDTTLYLIDFDAFSAPNLEPRLASLTLENGGSIGTEGYCPPDLLLRAEAGDTSAAPYSDRYGRDMLLLELLLLNKDMGQIEEPLNCWRTDKLRTGFAALKSRTTPDRFEALTHLQLPGVFTLPEDERPTSRAIAQAFSLVIPTAPKNKPPSPIWFPNSEAVERSHNSGTASKPHTSPTAGSSSPKPSQTAGPKPSHSSPPTTKPSVPLSPPVPSSSPFYFLVATALLVAVAIGVAAIYLFPSKDGEPAVELQPKPDLGVVVNIDMQLIPSGTFTMGTKAGHSRPRDIRQPWDELGRREWIDTEHQVIISKPFTISSREITQYQFAVVVGHDPEQQRHPHLTVNLEQEKQHPASHISWFDAIEFCNRLSQREQIPPYYEMTNIQRDSQFYPLSVKSAVVEILGGVGYRLPSEAEWEYACRANTTTEYHFGDYLEATHANLRVEGSYGGVLGAKSTPPATVAVGSYPPNSFGLFDMHGNVAEWCEDRFDGTQKYSYYERDKGRPNPFPINLTDPTGPTTGDDRVVKGGSFRFVEHHLGAGDRQSCRPDTINDCIGFRVARSVK